MNQALLSLLFLAARSNGMTKGPATVTREISDGDGGKLTTEPSGENVYHSPASRDTGGRMWGDWQILPRLRDSIGGDAPAGVSSFLQLPSDDPSTADFHPTKLTCRRRTVRALAVKHVPLPPLAEVKLYVTFRHSGGRRSPLPFRHRPSADSETATSRRLSDSRCSASSESLFRQNGFIQCGGTFGWSDLFVESPALGKL